MTAVSAGEPAARMDRTKSDRDSLPHTNRPDTRKTCHSVQTAVHSPYRRNRRPSNRHPVRMYHFPDSSCYDHWDQACRFPPSHPVDGAFSAAQSPGKRHPDRLLFPIHRENFFSHYIDGTLLCQRKSPRSRLSLPEPGSVLVSDFETLTCQAFS